MDFQLVILKIWDLCYYFNVSFCLTSEKIRNKCMFMQLGCNLIGCLCKLDAVIKTVIPARKCLPLYINIHE